MDEEIGNTVTDIIPVMYFFFLQKQYHSKCMHYRVTPTFIKETTGLVKVVEVRLVLLTTEEREICNLKKITLSDKADIGDSKRQ